ncbi:MAG TPA: hypothetical protein VJK25_00295 [Patescibacteria group bacterium]|nr:hypothetical protein [Patescibacteria group bacterium]
MEEYKIDDLSDKELKWGYWFVANQDKIRKIGLGLLILVCILIWISPIYGLVLYLAQFSQEQQIFDGLARQEINFADFIAENHPEALRFSEPQIIYTGGNKYDFVAQVTNPNPDRGVTKLAYRFAAGNFYGPASIISLLPGQTAYLTSLANESPVRLSGAALEIIKLEWQGLRARLDSLENPLELAGTTYGTVDNNSRFRVNFTATNISLKNYWQVDFQGILFSGSNIVGVNQISLAEFLAGESREVEISWFEGLPRVSRVEVIPLVDVYDQDNFFEIPGQAIDF